MMFFCHKKQDIKKIRRQQRQYIYQSLFSILENSDLEFLAPLHQMSAQTGKENIGYCHGYCSVWESIISEKKLFVEDKPEYKNFLFNENIDYIIPLDNDVKNRQKFQKKKYKNAVFCGDNYLTDMLKKHFTEINFYPDTMYIVDIGVLPPYGHFFFQRYPSQVKRWHEMRFWVDDKSFLHWFDPNIGWFKSRNSEPDLPQFFNALSEIFSLLSYDDRYQFICIEESVRKLEMRP